MHPDHPFAAGGPPGGHGGSAGHPGPGHPGGHPGGDGQPGRPLGGDGHPGKHPAPALLPGQVRAPRLVFWETTEACNLACVHCRRLSDSVRANPDQLSTTEALGMIDQLAAAGCMILVFSGGEPLMRPDLFDLLRHARDKGLMTAVASNGTLINDTIARELAAAGVRRVSISLDGPDAATHDGFRRIDGAFDASLGAIDNLKAAGIGVQINCTVASHNHDRLQEVHDLAVRIGAEALHFFMLVPVGCGLELAEAMMLSPQRYEEILNWIYEKDAEGGPLRIKATCAPHYMRIWLQRRKAAGLPLAARRRRYVPDDPRLPGRHGDRLRLASRPGLPVRLPARASRRPPQADVPGDLAVLAGPQGLSRAGQPAWQVRHVRVPARLPGLPRPSLRRHRRRPG